MLFFLYSVASLTMLMEKRRCPPGQNLTFHVSYLQKNKENNNNVR